MKSEAVGNSFRLIAGLGIVGRSKNDSEDVSTEIGNSMQGKFSSTTKSNDTSRKTSNGSVLPGAMYILLSVISERIDLTLATNWGNRTWRRRVQCRRAYQGAHWSPLLVRFHHYRWSNGPPARRNNCTCKTNCTCFDGIKSLSVGLQTRATENARSTRILHKVRKTRLV